MHRPLFRARAVAMPIAVLVACSIGPAAPDDTTIASASFVVDGGVIALGEWRELVATFRNAAGTVLAPVTDVGWRSSDTSIVLVDGDGRAFGRALGGPVTLTVTARGRSGMATARVVPARVDITPALTSLAVGSTVQLSGSPVDVASVAIGTPAGSVVWASSDPRVAVVDPNTGALTALTTGETEITATAAGRTDAMHIETGVPSAYDGSWVGGSECSDCQYAVTYPIAFDILFGTVRNFRMTVAGAPPLSQCSTGGDPVLLTPPVGAPNAVISGDHFELRLQLDLALVSGTFSSPDAVSGAHTAVSNIPIVCRGNILPVAPLSVAASTFSATKQ